MRRDHVIHRICESAGGRDAPEDYGVVLLSLAERRQIVEAMQVSQPTVSHHLSLLRSAGLVACGGRQAVFYTLNQERMVEGCCILAETFAPTRS